VTIRDVTIAIYASSMTDLVLTLIGPDRPGLVQAVAGIVAEHGGNWLESRMTRLAGKFAGILRAELPPDRAPAALAALAALEGQGLKIVAETAARAEREPPSRTMDLDLLGLDRPGIVREIAQLLASNGINVEELTTDRTSAPMSGEILFEARAHVHVPATTDLAQLRAALELLASDLMVEIKLEDRTGLPPGSKASKTRGRAP
jgi:glycine cleavage system regulatory protein